MKKLTRQKALHLLPLIVDNEASEDEKTAFYRYIQTDEDVRKKYESLIFVKQLLKTKYSPEKAPDHLKNKISEIIEDMKWEQIEHSKVDNTSSSVSVKTASETERGRSVKKPSPHFSVKKTGRYLAVAAVLLIFSILTIELLDKTSSNNFYASGIEEMALSHFNSGEHISASVASFRPASFSHASQLLNDELSHQPRLPEINGASLRRVIYTTFTEGFKTPVLEFYQDEINETVHIFAFRLDDLKKEYKMKRDPEAVKSCNTYDDYHIKEIEGKHVVSWKWGEYWYTAVSNHNGEDLIALMQPLNPNPGNDNDNDEGEGSGW
ncbi:hypothetical protein BH23BAC3_BH23BAC3_09700 [soil metagenome]